MPGGIDAIEVASTVTFGTQTNELRNHAGQKGIAMVGGSDAHSLAQVDQAFTLFGHMPTNEKELAAAIRNGPCKAMFLSGREHSVNHLKVSNWFVQVKFWMDTSRDTILVMAGSRHICCGTSWLKGIGRRGPAAG